MMVVMCQQRTLILDHEDKGAIFLKKGNIKPKKGKTREKTAKTEKNIQNIGNILTLLKGARIRLRLSHPKKLQNSPG